MHFNNCIPKCCTLTVKLSISSAVVGRDVLISGKLRDEAHVALGCGLNGGPQSDKWKHVATATETIDCQHIDAHRGANLPIRTIRTAGKMKTGGTRNSFWRRTACPESNLNAIGERCSLFSFMLHNHVSMSGQLSSNQENLSWQELRLMAAAPPEFRLTATFRFAIHNYTVFKMI